MHPPSVPIPVNEADPLGAYQAGAVERRSGRPIPLAATRFRVLLESGLAVVRTERVFRNAESQSIEATLLIRLGYTWIRRRSGMWDGGRDCGRAAGISRGDACG
jgi:hypothetical protein